MWSSSDLKEYRAGYPARPANPSKTLNIEFYRNERRMEPEDVTIDEVLSSWQTRYDHLEVCHSYIQWLFPIQEKGLNFAADPLDKLEIAAFREDNTVKQRLVESFKMMLHFYGFQMTYEDVPTSGVLRFKGSPKSSPRKSSAGNQEPIPVERRPVIQRHPDAKHARQRFHNLQVRGHNYLRITRILKCLGEAGYENMKIAWLLAFYEEIYRQDELGNCKESFDAYWLGTIYDDKLRSAFEKKVQLGTPLNYKLITDALNSYQRKLGSDLVAEAAQKYGPQQTMVKKAESGMDETTAAESDESDAPPLTRRSSTFTWKQKLKRLPREQRRVVFRKARRIWAAKFQSLEQDDLTSTSGDDDEEEEEHSEDDDDDLDDDIVSNLKAMMRKETDSFMAGLDSYERSAFQAFQKVAQGTAKIPKNMRGKGATEDDTEEESQTSRGKRGRSGTDSEEKNYLAATAKIVNSNNKKQADPLRKKKGKGEGGGMFEANHEMWDD